MFMYAQVFAFFVSFLIVDNFAERLSAEISLKLTTTPNLDTPKSPPEAPKNNESPDKYKDILSYLDNVEDSCERTLLETRRSMPDTNRSEVEFVVEPDIAEDVPKYFNYLFTYLFSPVYAQPFSAGFPIC